MMRFLALCGLVLSGSVVFAQPADKASAKGPDEVTASDLTLQGCLQGTKHGHFTLLQVSTGAAFVVQGNADDFKRSRGKLVEVRGTELAPTAGRGMQSLPQLKIASLRVVADKCPIQGNGITATRNNNSAGHSAPLSPETPSYQRPDAPEQSPPTADTNPNGAGATGAPSAGTGNPPKP